MDDRRIIDMERWLNYLAESAKKEEGDSVEILLDQYFDDEITFEELDRKVFDKNYKTFDIHKRNNKQVEKV